MNEPKVKEIEVGIYGSLISQATVDNLSVQVALAKQEGYQTVHLVLKYVDVRNFPRLIVDYGGLFETLCEVAKEYREYRRAMEMPTYAMREIDIGNGLTASVVVPCNGNARGIDDEGSFADEALRNFNKVEFGIPGTAHRQVEVHDSAHGRTVVSIGSTPAGVLGGPTWTCTNHAEPITYTTETECYCGQKK